MLIEHRTLTGFLVVCSPPSFSSRPSLGSRLRQKVRYVSANRGVWTDSCDSPEFQRFLDLRVEFSVSQKLRVRMYLFRFVLFRLAGSISSPHLESLSSSVRL
jgi:hypothetical protein